MCAYYSGNYASFLIRQCSNAVPVKLKKWYLAALWRLWRKVKYLEIKSWKKHSMKLLSEECIHFRQRELPLRCPVWKFCLWGICEGIFSDAQISVVRKEMSSDEKWKEGLGIHLIELKHRFYWTVWNHCFCGTWERIFGNALKNMLKKEYPPIKRKLSVKLLSVTWIAFVQSSFCFHWAVF